MAYRIGCPMCNRQHPLRLCIRFLASNVTERLRFVMYKGLCSVCLVQSHRSNASPSCGMCKTCEKNHNTLLHELPKSSVFVKMSVTFKFHPPGGDTVILRALIDLSLETSVIDKSVVDDMDMLIYGLKEPFRCFIKVGPHWDRTPTDEIELNIGDVPMVRNPDQRVFRHWKATDEDANPLWNVPLQYNIIIGSNKFFRCIRGGPIIEPNKPPKVNTTFGWVYFGEATMYTASA